MTQHYEQVICQPVCFFLGHADEDVSVQVQSHRMIGDLKHKTQDETDGLVGEQILGYGGRQIMQDKLPEIGTHKKIPIVPKWQS